MALPSKKFWSASHLYAFRLVMFSLLNSNGVNRPLFRVHTVGKQCARTNAGAATNCARRKNSGWLRYQVIWTEIRMSGTISLRSFKRWDGECSVCGLFATHVLRTVAVCIGSKADDPATRFGQDTAPLVPLVANDVFKCPAGSAISWWPKLNFAMFKSESSPGKFAFVQDRLVWVSSRELLLPTFQVIRCMFQCCCRQYNDFSLIFEVYVGKLVLQVAS